MERNALSFLDLVTQFLAVMIIVIAVSARSGQGVGLVNPTANFTVICAVLPDRPKDGQMVASTNEKNDCAVQIIPGEKSTIVLVSARRTKTATGPKQVVRVSSDWWDKVGEIRSWNPAVPDEPIVSKGSLKANRDKFGSVEFVEAQ
jgi:hypothetical protein